MAVVPNMQAITTVQEQPPSSQPDVRMEEGPGNFITSPALAAISRHEQAAAPSNAPSARTKPKNRRQQHPTLSALVPQPSFVFEKPSERKRQTKAQQATQSPTSAAPPRAPSPLHKPHPLLNGLTFQQQAQGPLAAVSASTPAKRDRNRAVGHAGSGEGGAAARDVQLEELFDNMGSLDNWVASEMPALTSHVALGILDEAASECLRCLGLIIEIQTQTIQCNTIGHHRILILQWWTCKVSAGSWIGGGL